MLRDYIVGAAAGLFLALVLLFSAPHVTGVSGGLSRGALYMLFNAMGVTALLASVVLGVLGLSRALRGDVRVARRLKGLAGDKVKVPIRSAPLAAVLVAFLALGSYATATTLDRNDKEDALRSLTVHRFTCDGVPVTVEGTTPQAVHIVAQACDGWTLLPN